MAKKYLVYKSDLTDFEVTNARILKGLNRTLLDYQIFKPYSEHLLIFLMQVMEDYKVSLETDKQNQNKVLSETYKQLNALNTLLDKEFPFLEVDEIKFCKKSRKIFTISKGNTMALVMMALKNDIQLRSQAKISNRFILKGSPKKDSITILKKASIELYNLINKGFLVTASYKVILNANELSKHFKSANEKYDFISKLLSLITKDSVSPDNIKNYLKPFK